MTDNTISADDSTARVRQRPRKRGALYFLRDILVIFVIALVVSFVIKTFLVRSFYIPSSSMEHTLEINDRILVNQLVPDLIGVERGDVVVFRDPGGWLPVQPKAQQSPFVVGAEWVLSLFGLSSPDNDDHLIKRVIGLPGDNVVCCNALGQMSINGVPVDEPYVNLPNGVSSVSKDDFDVTVPEGALWVMGDNRYNSKDSRYNREQPGDGFVPLENVVGRAFVINWPVDHWGWLGNYPTVFGGVPDTK
ncbi:signal peptidase I [Okibacterium endophyticum]